tara:strand:- start:736 stop:918 length:183 start_codon:yes stop_codon:yes gene_type:complete
LFHATNKKIPHGCILERTCGLALAAAAAAAASLPCLASPWLLGSLSLDKWMLLLQVVTIQ